MARLPKLGERSWGSVLNDYLKQSLNSDGTLVSDPTNPHTGGPNTNLAGGSRPGIVSLTHDLKGVAHAPIVSGLQGKPVAPTTPTNGQALVWDEDAGAWKPTTIGAGSTDTAAHARAMAVNSVGI